MSNTIRNYTDKHRTVRYVLSGRLHCYRLNEDNRAAVVREEGRYSFKKKRGTQALRRRVSMATIKATTSKVLVDPAQRAHQRRRRV